ncbi:MAG: FecR domain-containing protein [Polyangiaceae bacterium]|nr:FecR domain-containing protein [Polyangiaceae bacterium]MBK8942564.1 FecR domain-containing protein [Polyangiaceae bacterium]
MRGAGVGLIVASVLGSSPAVAQDFPEPVVQWGVQPDESCEDIAQVVWGDARHAPLVMRYNAVTCTRGAPLKVGLTLILPAKVTAPAAARIRSIVPSVQARPPGGSWSAAAQGAPLDDNSGVQTLETGRASIQFLDRSQLMLSENTLVVIFGTASQSTVGSRGAPKIEIDQGEVRAMVAALRGEPLEVATPGGGSVAATSRETVIERKGDRSTVVVFEGSARVANA